MPEPRILGLPELRRDLAAMQRGLPALVEGAAAKDARMVAAVAASLAPRKAGTLAASLAARANAVQSTLAYAAPHEFGAVLSPRGVPITIRRSRFIGRALDQTADRALGFTVAAFDVLARRTGWR